ncbi:MAG: hypothetical protein Q8Q42_02815 [Nanoarchaeota archaeon]|nr:hypothetical protein [Nanoarchaeota archaeon]
MANKKNSGQIWISAILFMSLGIITIALVLTAAIPMVNRISDKNTVTMTKEILLKVDDTIKTVANEGPGSQRQLDPLVIEKGELIIANGTYNLLWRMDTKADLMEKNIEVTEGNIHQVLNSTYVEEVNNIKVWVTSSKYNVTINSRFNNPFKGEYVITIKHTGRFDEGTDNPIIEIRVN